MIVELSRLLFTLTTTAVGFLVGRSAVEWFPRLTTDVDVATITGCPFTVPTGKPQPCVTVEWMTSALRIKIEGQAALLSVSQGLCKSAEQAPQGPVNISVTQSRVTGQ